MTGDRARMRPGTAFRGAIGKLCRCALGLAVLPMIVPASCRPRGATVVSPVALPSAFSAEGRTAMPTKWWTAFGDARLNALIARALQDNFSLRVAWDRLDQARATAARSGAPLWPELDGTGGASRTVTRTPAAGRAYTNELSLGVLAGYEVDLWGRVRSTHDASRLDAYASSEDLHAAAVTLTAELARTWYLLVEQRGQLKLLDEQIATNGQHLEIISLKFRRGKVSAADVLQQRQLVESTRGDRVLVESAVEVLVHQLAVLVGRRPGDLTVDAPRDLPHLPPLPRTGVPIERIRRRPDVRAAELRVQAADRQVAAALADQFPRLSLSVSAETSAARVRDLFDNWLAGMAANVVAPLLDGGLRRAEVRRTRAALSEKLNAYGQVVLAALQEVEDALSQEARQSQYVASLTRQLELSKQSTERTRDSYANGTMDFVRYLTTLLAHQRLQRSHLQAERQLVEYRIDLYRALAGSWPLPRADRAAPPGAVKAIDYQYDDEPRRPAQPRGLKR